MNVIFFLFTITLSPSVSFPSICFAHLSLFPSVSFLSVSFPSVSFPPSLSLHLFPSVSFPSSLYLRLFPFVSFPSIFTTSISSLLFSIPFHFFLPFFPFCYIFPSFFRRFSFLSLISWCLSAIISFPLSSSLALPVPSQLSTPTCHLYPFILHLSSFPSPGSGSICIQAAI